MKFDKNKGLKVVFFLILFASAACRNKQQEHELPLENSERKELTTKPLNFEKKQAVKWTTKPFPGLNSFPLKQFSLKNIPSKPFTTGGEVYAGKPSGEEPIRLDYRDTSSDLKSIPAKPLSFKVTLLPAPNRIKAMPPKGTQGSFRGILSYGQDEGLVGSIIIFSRCDRYGLLWIGTEKGLCVYDGENFEVFNLGPGMENMITNLLEDKNGAMWIGNYQGKVFLLDRRSRVLKQAEDPDPSPAIILGMVEDDEGKIWITSSNGKLSIIDPSDNTIRILNKKGELNNDVTSRITRDRYNRVWVNNSGRASVWDLKNHTIRHIDKIRGNETILSALEDNTGTMWISTSKATLYKISRDGHFAIPSGVHFKYPVYTLAKDKKGNIWAGCDSGRIYVYNPSRQTVEFMRIDVPTRVFDFTEDRQGQVWISLAGTGGGYLIKRNEGKAGNFGRMQGMTDNNVWGLLEDKKGNIWMGTYNGIDIYDPAHEQIRHLGTEQGLKQLRQVRLLQVNDEVWTGSDSVINIINTDKGTIRTLGRSAGLDMRFLSYLQKDSHGRIWAASFDGRLRIIDLHSNTVSFFDNPNPDSAVSFIKEDSSGFIWIGIRDYGIYVLDPDLKHMRQATVAGGLASGNVTDWVEDDSKNIWLSTENGIQRINAGLKTSVILGTDEGLPKKESYSIARRGKLIYAGTSDGLAVIGPVPPAGKKSLWPVRVYKKSQGLAYLDFNQGTMMFTRKGKLYAGVEQTLLVMEEPGIDTVVPSPFITGIDILGESASFLPRDLPEDAKTQDTLRKADTGSVHTPKDKMASRSDALRKRHIVWKDVQGPFNMPEGLVLPYNQNYLTFHFTGSQLSNPDNVRYRYILEGVDKVWSQVSDQNVSDNYRDLPPGKYVFKVAAKGFNNLWSAPYSLHFSISPPWWKTWWAFGFYLLLLAGAIRAFIIYRSRQLQAENRLLEEKVAQRTEELNMSLKNLQATQSQLITAEKMASLGELTAGVAHEIQNPLNFVNNFAEVSIELASELKEEIEKLSSEAVKDNLLDLTDDLIQNQQKINYHGKRADSIVKSMLQHSRASSDKKELVDINALADEYLRLAYHGMRAKDKSFNAELVTHFDESLPLVSIVPQEIGRVLLNLLTNAFYATLQKKKTADEKYKPEVSISTLLKGSTVEITVKDNGTGIPDVIKGKILQPFFTTKPTGEGTGLGLSLSYDIVVKGHNGSININSAEGEFSEFIITLPVHAHDNFITNQK